MLRTGNFLKEEHFHLGRKKKNPKHIEKLLHLVLKQQGQSRPGKKKYASNKQ